MGRVMLLLSVVLLLAITAGCGGGSSAVNSGSSLVSISVGGNGKSARISIEKNTFFARAGFLARKFIASAGSAFAAIPAGVTEIEFTISGPEPDFQPQSRKVPVVSGGVDITEQFVVPNGNKRRFLVEANNISGHLYRGENTVDLTGIPITVGVTMVPLFTPSLNMTFSITPSEVVIVESTTVMIDITATLTNSSNETLNSITCQDTYGTELTGIPTSLATGASATISGSYTPNPLTGPYSDTITCAGTGAQSGSNVTQTRPASNNFTPAISFVGGGDLGTFCGSGDGGIWVSGSLFSSGDESVSNVICSAPELSTMYFYGITSITSLSFLDISSAPVNFDSDFISGSRPTVRVTCSGTGYFSGVAFSNATTLTCQ